MTQTGSPNKYSSEYGWTIDLPAGWRALSPPGTGKTLTSSTPVVCADPEDSRCSLTWMFRSHALEPATTRRFHAVTRVSGPVNGTLAAEVAQEIFALIGELESAEVVELPGSIKALEILECFTDQGVENRGYQLIFSSSADADDGSAFQRLCFYAPAGRFAQSIAAVRAAARSFCYS